MKIVYVANYDDEIKVTLSKREFLALTGVSVGDDAYYKTKAKDVLKEYNLTKVMDDIEFAHKIKKEMSDISNKLNFINQIVEDVRGKM